MNRHIKFAGISLVSCLLACLAGAGIDYGSTVKGDEKELYVEQFGRDEPTIISNGYLFVEFKYIPAPYKIERIGQAIVVNGVAVNCLYRGPLPTTNDIAKFHADWRHAMHGYKQDTPKQLAQMQTRMLADSLSNNAALFLSKTSYQERQRSRSRTDSALSMVMPRFHEWRQEEFLEVMGVVLSDDTEDAKVSAIKAFQYWGMNAEDTKLFIKNALESSIFVERVRGQLAEIRRALAEGP